VAARDPAPELLGPVEGHGYGWDKTRTGLLVLVAAIVLTWTPPVSGRYELRVRVPVEWQPDGISLRAQTWMGHLRG